MNKERELQTAIKKIRLIPQKYPRLTPAAKVGCQVRSLYLELLNLSKKGEFNKGLILINNTDKRILEAHEELIQKFHKHMLYMAIVNIYFGSGNYKKALLWLNKLLNDVNLGLLEDIQCFARIFNLILHYELKNIEILEHLLKTTYRYLRKKQRLYRFERSILKFIRKLSHSFNEKQLTLGFIRLKQELEEILKDPHEGEALFFFDFASWLQSKIENREFAEIVKEKAKAF